MSYDAEGSLAGQYATDANGATTEQYSYEYDSLGRLIHSKELDGSGNMVQRTEHLYDTSNRVRAQNWMFANGASFGQDYSYSNGADGDGTLTTLSSSATMDGYGFYPSVTYTYNTLRQLTRKTTDNLFYRAYAYRAIHIRSAAAQAMNLHFLQEKALEHMVPELFSGCRECGSFPIVVQPFQLLKIVVGPMPVVDDPVYDAPAPTVLADEAL